MKTEKQFGIDVVVIEESINLDVNDEFEVDAEIIENFKELLRGE